MGATAGAGVFCEVRLDTMSSDGYRKWAVDQLLVGVAPVFPAEFCDIQIGPVGGRIRRCRSFLIFQTSARARFSAEVNGHRTADANTRK